MKILAYCYGPTCVEKDIFCEKFIEENDDYELVSSSSIRLKLSKSALVENKIVEQMVMEEEMPMMPPETDEAAELAAFAQELNTRSKV
jgi:hypothetical protein